MADASVDTDENRVRVTIDVPLDDDRPHVDKTVEVNESGQAWLSSDLKGERVRLVAIPLDS